MVRVRYTALAKLFALIVFGFFILPSLFRIFNQPNVPSNDSPRNDFGPIAPQEDHGAKRLVDDEVIKINFKQETKKPKNVFVSEYIAVVVLIVVTQTYIRTI